MLNDFITEYIMKALDKLDKYKKVIKCPDCGIELKITSKKCIPKDLKIEQENSMCVSSMIYDHFYDKWKFNQPQDPYIIPTLPPYIPIPTMYPYIKPEEIDEFRKLLDRAREYDKKNNQPDCELEEKRLKLKKLAEELGVEINFI